jgi:DNA-binding NarL/FixJ family response regulator
MVDSVANAYGRVDIVLADDHAMVRSGLRRVLDSERDFVVVAEAGDVETAIDAAREHQPHVVVLDLNMPGLPTLSAIPDFLTAAPGTAIIVLTMDAEPRYARSALRAGARGYVLKEAADAALVEAVRAVVAGRTYLEPSLGAKLAATDPEPGPAHEPPALAIGSIFAGHRIDEVVGRGGMGVVFRASDRILDRTVALKVIMPEVAGDPVFRARFERECRLAAALDHPHIVEVFHAGEEQGLLYLTMRFVEGSDLRRLLDAETRLEPSRAVAIAAHIASALDAAHGLALIHRDVKPENVLITRRPGGEHAFLTDFGITKRAADEPLTRTGVAIGTVDYTAPEQARGTEVDARADVYSLGCLLFRMLTGRVVFPRGTELDKLFAHVHEPPPELLDVVPDLPPRLQDVLDRALAKDPRERQQSAGELAESARDELTR